VKDLNDLVLAPEPDVVSEGEVLSPAGSPARTEAATVLAAISAVRRTARRAVRHAWQTEPLPPAQGELLRLVAARPGIIVADAAHELRLAPNTVSTLVGKLTDAGLLRRVRGETDGRTARLTVTEQAAERIAEYRDLRAELAGPALARLAPDDRAALARAVPALRRLAELMEE
jgi:DNA-binding MarR family transcriptional regulator